MKKVFKNSSEVCHIFVNGVQSEGRCSNVFFYNDLIYSYGYHFCMAKKIDYQTILITNRSYSVTTSKHLSELRYAANHKDRIYCAYPEKGIFENLPSIANDLKECFNKLTNNRTRQTTKDNSKAEILGILENTNKLFQVFKTDINKLQKEFKKQNKLVHLHEDVKILEFFDLWTIAQTLDFNLLNQLNAKRLKKLEQIEKKRKQAILKENEEKINKWLIGENVYLSNSIDKVFLRSDGENLETSKGAIVSLRSAKILFDLIQAKKDIKGHIIDGYTVISINGVLTIGCHKIELSEINRFAKVQNWI